MHISRRSKKGKGKWESIQTLESVSYEIIMNQSEFIMQYVQKNEIIIKCK